MISKKLENTLFDEALEKIIEGKTAREILKIPGVYEAVSEELNNEACNLMATPDTEWVYSVLTNNERATDEELVDLFVEELDIPTEQSEWYVSHRSEFRKQQQ